MADPEPKEVAPYQTIRRGETWQSNSEGVIFSDYSPRVMPDDGEPPQAPKDSSAAASVESSSPKKRVTQVKAAPLSAVKDSGLPKVKE